MSYFKPNYEWLSPKTPVGKKRNKKDGKPTGQTHFSVNDRRLEAIESEGYLACCAGELRESNPKISNQSRTAWFKGWDSADKMATEGTEGNQSDD